MNNIRLGPNHDELAKQCPPARLQIRCDRPVVTVGQDAVQALFATRSALKTCEGKRRDWNKFYRDVRAKR